MIVVVGLSHQAAPIEVREELAFSTERAAEFAKDLVMRVPVREAMVLSTCNRVEVIAAAESADEQLLAEVASVCAHQLESRATQASRYLYRHSGQAAVRHLFRVAASLDSMVVGEPQILGQLKQAFDAACRAGTVGSILHKAVPRALRTAKQVRSETQIGSGQVSVPSVAVDLARQVFGELSGKTALLIGSGEMGQTVARLLAGHGAALQVLGRNPAAVASIAREVGGQPRAFSDLTASLVEADVVVASTSAPHFVVTKEIVSSIRRSRRGRSLFFIDLAVPRDIDPLIDALDGTFVYNIDNFSRVVAESLANRQREREAAERIVARAAEGYERWAEAEQVTPVIKALRARFSQVLQTELERSLRGRLKGLGSAERQALQKMVEASVNKMLHEPSSTLRALAGDKNRDSEGWVESALDVLTTLFSLELSVSDEPPKSEPEIGRESGPHPTSSSQEDAATTGSR